MQGEGHLSRTPVLIAAIVCGVIAILGASISAYSYLQTPGISEVPIYADGQFVRTESKAVYLSALPIGQIFICLILTYHVLRWDRFREKLIASDAYFKNSSGALRNLHAPTLLASVSIGFCLLQTLLLISNIQLCVDVLSKS